MNPSTLLAPESSELVIRIFFAGFVAREVARSRGLRAREPWQEKLTWSVVTGLVSLALAEMICNFLEPLLSHHYPFCSKLFQVLILLCYVIGISRLARWERIPIRYREIFAAPRSVQVYAFEDLFDRKQIRLFTADGKSFIGEVIAWEMDPSHFETGHLIIELSPSKRKVVLRNQDVAKIEQLA